MKELAESYRGEEGGVRLVVSLNSTGEPGSQDTPRPVTSQYTPPDPKGIQACGEPVCSVTGQCPQYQAWACVRWELWPLIHFEPSMYLCGEEGIDAAWQPQVPFWAGWSCTSQDP